MTGKCNKCSKTFNRTVVSGGGKGTRYYHVSGRLLRGLSCLKCTRAYERSAWKKRQKPKVKKDGVELLGAEKPEFSDPTRQCKVCSEPTVNRYRCRVCLGKLSYSDYLTLSTSSRWVERG